MKKVVDIKTSILNKQKEEHKTTHTHKWNDMEIATHNSLMENKQWKTATENRRDFFADGDLFLLEFVFPFHVSVRIKSSAVARHHLCRCVFSLPSPIFLT